MMFQNMNRDRESWAQLPTSKWEERECRHAQQDIAALYETIASLQETGRGMMVTTNQALARAMAAEEKLRKLEDAIKLQRSCNRF